MKPIALESNGSGASAGNVCLRSLLIMRVTFTKLEGRRYLMTAVRERGPELAPRHGPGYDDYLPHDVVHVLAESEAGLSRGVFGRVAVGWSNIFTTADPAVRRHQARRKAKRRPRATDHANMARSESLASLCQPLWELRAGLHSELPLWTSRVEPVLVASPLVERIIERLGEFAARWHALPAGGSVTLVWPLGRQRRSGRRHLAQGTGLPGRTTPGVAPFPAVPSTA